MRWSTLKVFGFIDQRRIHSKAAHTLHRHGIGNRVLTSRRGTRYHAN
jgi:hypothetical protein